jgi:hypothetical protein
LRLPKAHHGVAVFVLPREFPERGYSLVGVSHHGVIAEHENESATALPMFLEFAHRFKIFFAVERIGIHGETALDFAEYAHRFFVKVGRSHYFPNGKSHHYRKKSEYD